MRFFNIVLQRDIFLKYENRKNEIPKRILERKQPKQTGGYLILQRDIFLKFFKIIKKQSKNKMKKKNNQKLKNLDV